MQNFRYINTIKNKNGKLREWEEYDILEQYENICWSNEVSDNYHNEIINKGLMIKDKESNEERSRIQKNIQKIS